VPPSPTQRIAPSPARSIEQSVASALRSIGASSCPIPILSTQSTFRRPSRSPLEYPRALSLSADPLARERLLTAR
jgi:hypothetical protein